MLKPMENMVIIEKCKVKETSDGGIILPEDCNNSDVSWGEVVAMGARTNCNDEFIPTQYNVGDRVLFAVRNTPIEYQGKKYYIMSQNSIMAVEE